MSILFVKQQFRDSDSENKRQMRERRTMAEFRRIPTVLIFILMSHFTVSGEHVYITVRDGGDVTLPCENVTEDQDKCDRTDWIFNKPQHTTAELVQSGQIDKSQISNRLSVTETCSLVIKNVTDKDFGLYSCRHEGSDSVVDLSVVTITEHKDNNQVTLSCSVWTYEPCRHTVNWLFKGQVMVKDHGFKISQSDCSARLTVEDNHFVLPDNYDLLKCNVTDSTTRKVQQFSFRRQSSGGETGEDTTTTSGPEQTTKSDTDTGTDASVTWKAWLRCLVVSAALAGLIVAVLAVNRCTRAKGPPS